MESLLICKLSKQAILPFKYSKRSAGYDLFSPYDYVVYPGGKLLVLTDLKIQVPSGCYGRIAPRSSLAIYHHITIGGGVLDADFRGNVGVIIFNHGKKKFFITRGMRIAQLICEKILHPEIKEVYNLEPTERGEGGFGSSETTERGEGDFGISI